MTKPDENNLPREGLETARFPTVKVVGSNPSGPTTRRTDPSRAHKSIGCAKLHYSYDLWNIAYSFLLWQKRARAYLSSFLERNVLKTSIK